VELETFDGNSGTIERQSRGGVCHDTLAITDANPRPLTDPQRTRTDTGRSWLKVDRDRLGDHVHVCRFVPILHASVLDEQNVNVESIEVRCL
jgi:hypothetical protein